MYKRASDQQSFQQRVASHATKAFATGRVDDVPAWAKEPEEYYKSMRQRWEALATQRTNIQTELEQIKRTTLNTLPHEEFRRLDRRREHLVGQQHRLDAELKGLLPTVVAAATNAWGTVFFHVARTLLDEATFEKICAEVAELLGRSTPRDGLQVGGNRYRHGDKKRKHDKEAGNRWEDQKRAHKRGLRYAPNLEVRWELIGGKYRRVVVKNGVRTVET